MGDHYRRYLYEPSIEVVPFVSLLERGKTTQSISWLTARIGSKGLRTQPLRPRPSVLRLPLREPFVSCDEHLAQLDRLPVHRSAPGAEPIVLLDVPDDPGASRLDHSPVGQFEPALKLTGMSGGDRLGAGNVLGTVGEEAAGIGLDVVGQLRFRDAGVDELSCIAADSVSVGGKDTDSGADEAASGSGTDPFEIALGEDSTYRFNDVLADPDDEATSVLLDPVEDQF